MRKAFSTFMVCLACYTGYCQATQDAPTELTWHSDINKAYTSSRQSNKPIFAFFTGSDWCGWCRKLQNEVFHKPEFIKWASDNVVLLELDYPKRKELPEELKRQNQELQQFFQVKGFPTIWIFSMTQNADKKFVISGLGTLGYPRNAERGREQIKFLQDANTVLAKGKK